MMVVWFVMNGLFAGNCLLCFGKAIAAANVGYMLVPFMQTSKQPFNLYLVLNWQHLVSLIIDGLELK